LVAVVDQVKRRKTVHLVDLVEGQQQMGPQVFLYVLLELQAKVIAVVVDIKMRITDILRDLAVVLEDLVQLLQQPV
jgi:hypothetical protein